MLRGYWKPAVALAAMIWRWPLDSDAAAKENPAPAYHAGSVTFNAEQTEVLLYGPNRVYGTLRDQFEILSKDNPDHIIHALEANQRMAIKVSSGVLEKIHILAKARRIVMAQLPNGKLVNGVVMDTGQLTHASHDEVVALLTNIDDWSKKIGIDLDTATF